MKKEKITLIIFGIFIIAGTFFSGFFIAKDKYRLKLAPLTVYKQSWYPNDIVIGSSDYDKDIRYIGYDSKNKLVRFWDNATLAPINVTLKKSNSITVFDPVSNNLQSRTFSIDYIEFVKTANGYILRGNLNATWYKESYSNIPDGVLEAYDDGYNTGYYIGLHEIIDYDKINEVVLDGNNVELPSNYGWTFGRDDNDRLVVQLTKDSGSVIIDIWPVAYNNLTFVNWNFTGEKK